MTIPKKKIDQPNNNNNRKQNILRVGNEEGEKNEKTSHQQL